MRISHTRAFLANMGSREIISVQVGHYSNFIGTHWWNIQEAGFVYDPKQTKEISNDVLFREGQNQRADVTFTPRLVAFDLKGSLKTLKQEGTLYEGAQEEEDDIKWSGDVTMHTESGTQKNRFLKQLDKEDGVDDKDETDEDFDTDPDTQKKGHDKEHSKQMSSQGSSGDVIFGSPLYDLADSVKVWSDFLRVHLHPKSIQIVEQYRHNDQLYPFTLYGCGDEVMRDYTTISEWEDRLHFFVEECDSLQGFHMLLDTHDGFGGLGSALLSYLEEEFPGKGILTFGFNPTDSPDSTASERCTRIINSALTYDQACSHSSLFIPCSLAGGLWRKLEPPRQFPYLSYKPSSYHTSSMLACALDTLSQPYRMDTNPIHLQDITHSLNSQGRKMASLYSGFPLGLSSESSLVDLCASRQQKFPWSPLTPHIKNEAVPFMQSVVLRGVPKGCVNSGTVSSQLPRHLVNCETPEQVLDAYIDERCPGVLSAKTVISEPCKTTIPFPHIFQRMVDKTGMIVRTERPLSQGVDSVPAVTSLQSTPEVADVLDTLHDAAAKLNIKKHHKYLELGLEEDEYTDTLNNIQTLAGNYRLNSEVL